MKAAEPVVNAGYYSEDDNHDFNFNLTGYTNTSLLMKLNFQKPEHISQHSADNEAEKLVVKYYGNVFFFDTRGVFLPENTTISKTIPPQFIQDGWAEQMLEGAG